MFIAEQDGNCCLLAVDIVNDAKTSLDRHGIKDLL